MQLHTSAQKSPGRPWPFLSPRLVTFHCSELRPAHVGVRENWLCWAGTTSRPQLVPPGSPQFRVSAQLPGLLQLRSGMHWHSRVGHLSTHPPGHLSHSLWICMVLNHLGLPHPAARCCVQGVNSPSTKRVTPSTLLMLGSTQLWTWHWLYHIFTCGQTQGSLQFHSLEHRFPARLECSGKR